MATVYYSTVALVKDRFKFISSQLSDSEIQDMIEAVEGVVDVLIGKSYKNSFDSSIHGILREVVTRWVTIECINYDRSEAYDQGIDVEQVLSGMNDKLDMLLKQLQLEKTKKMLDGL